MGIKNRITLCLLYLRGIYLDTVQDEIRSATVGVFGSYIQLHTSMKPHGIQSRTGFLCIQYLVGIGYISSSSFYPMIDEHEQIRGWWCWLIPIGFRGYLGTQPIYWN